MSPSPLLVRGGTVVTTERVVPADVVIADGRVRSVLPPGGADLAGHRVIDAGGLLVLPGMIDAHVHFQEPGREGWEGFDTGSAAAAAGGVTTVVDMPIDSHPPTITAALVAAKADAARRHSRVDVAVWAGLVPQALAHLDDLVRAGAVGFKAFACPSGWDDFPACDEATLAAGMAAAARLDVPVAVHCELEPLGHGADSEVAALRWAARLAAGARARLHAVHVSAAAAVDEARRWPRVTVETCPHYLVLDDLDAARIGPAAHCNPPIRDAGNRAALWERLLGGAIDVVASDHSPCPPSWKAAPDPWAGIDGVGLTLPLLLSDQRLSAPAVVRLTTAAARILRLAGKGSIVEGGDADLALVDAGATWVPTTDSLRTRHRFSPFIGRTLTSRVVMTLVRGRVVFSLDDGPSPPGGAVLVGSPGHSAMRGSATA